jgi:hypothetical protein
MWNTPSIRPQCLLDASSVLPLLPHSCPSKSEGEEYGRSERGVGEERDKKGGTGHPKWNHSTPLRNYYDNFEVWHLEIQTSPEAEI